MIEIDVVCPVYNNAVQLNKMLEGLKKQEKVKINKIVCPFTLSDNLKINGEIRGVLNAHQVEYFELLKDDFSHSLTRERAIRGFCSSGIVVLVSQDIVFMDSLVLYNLTRDIDSGETKYNYARQVCTNKSIEKYIRPINYPSESRVVDKSMIDKMQIMAFFASDACAALDREVFLKLNGYQGFDVKMNEDQLYSKILLDAGYKKKYCADAVVEHSHKYTLKQLYTRYYETGQFYKSVRLFDNYKFTSSGKKLAFSVLGQALKHFDIPVLLRWLPDMSARYLGMKKGKK